MTKAQKEDQAEIMELIKFYNKRGWCWLSVVSYIAAKVSNGRI